VKGSRENSHLGHQPQRTVRDPERTQVTSPHGHITGLAIGPQCPPSRCGALVFDFRKCGGLRDFPHSPQVRGRYLLHPARFCGSFIMAVELRF
jgi:hypothetical protein